jgi:hypothetical protein
LKIQKNTACLELEIAKRTEDVPMPSTLPASPAVLLLCLKLTGREIGKEMIEGVEGIEKMREPKFR